MAECGSISDEKKTSLICEERVMDLHSSEHVRDRRRRSERVWQWAVRALRAARQRVVISVINLGDLWSAVQGL